VCWQDDRVFAVRVPMRAGPPTVVHTVAAPSTMLVGADSLGAAAITRDGRLVVFDLDAARSSEFLTSPVVAQVGVGASPSDVTFSADGKWLLALSQATTSDQDGARSVPGTLTVIDAAAAETGSTQQAKTVIPAG
jgi:hypothetical protein